MKYIKIKFSLKKAIVDDETYLKVNSHNWYLHKNDRIMGHINGKDISMARFILNSNAEKIDHKDCDIFNNQKENLREATTQQNNANRRIGVDNTSGYKGVSWHKASNKWRAYISYNNQHIHLGNFFNVKDAAEAYNKAALKYFKEFARLNIIE